MSFQVTGKITKVLELQQGTSSAGKEWQKQSIIVETDEQYNNLYCFEIFGAEKVEDFNQRYHIGDKVAVDFNINTNEWNEKYFTSLPMWKIDIVEKANQQSVPPEVDNQGSKPKDMPF